MPVNTALLRKCEDNLEKIKQSIYEALRKDNPNEVLKSFDDPAIKKYMANLIAGNKDHDHIIRMLDDKLDMGQAALVCEIFEKVGVKFIEKISARIKLCNSLPKVVNVESKLLLFHYTDISKKLATKHNLCSDVMHIIYKFAIDATSPLTTSQIKLAATTNKDAREVAFMKNRSL